MRDLDLGNPWQAGCLPGCRQRRHRARSIRSIASSMLLCRTCSGFLLRMSRMGRGRLRRLRDRHVCPFTLWVARQQYSARQLRGDAPEEAITDRRPRSPGRCGPSRRPRIAGGAAGRRTPGRYCRVRNWLETSAGVFHPSVIRGRVFVARATGSQPIEVRLSSLPIGKY